MAKLIPNYSTLKFTDIYCDEDTFLRDYNESGIPTTIKDENAKTLFYLLYARYGNNPIANYDDTQFKYKLFSIVFMYGPTWEKRLDIQKELRGLTKADMKSGASRVLNMSGSDTSHRTSSGDTTDSGKNIKNHAFDPTTSPTTSELNYIDQQTVDNMSGATHNTAEDNNTNTSTGQHSEDKTLGTLEAYTILWELLDNDVTNDFVSKFRHLFKQFVAQERRFIFVTGEDEDDQETVCF